MKRLAAFAAVFTVAACALLGWQLREKRPAQTGMDEAAKREVLRGYRRLGHLSYEASYHAAGTLNTRILALLAEPSEASLLAARQAWREAHRDYSQTEAFRFGNWIVDDWELGVNAWPVDEGLLDYVAGSYAASPTNPLARHNLVASPSIEVNGITLDIARLDWTQLKFIHGGSDNETNVVLGFHAIEFLLWGQDLRVGETGAGQRPFTDFVGNAKACTSGPERAPALHCARRRQLLQTMAEHLYTQLGNMTLNWAGSSPSSYGLHIATGDVHDGLRRMLFGLLRLSSDEMAGQRMQVALLTHAPEEEQDCFSDDTHQSLYYNAVGIQNIYYGRYQNPRYDQGKAYVVPMSLAALARRLDGALAKRIDAALASTQRALDAIRQQGDEGQTFDLLMQPENRHGAQLIQQAIQALEAESLLWEELGQRLALGSLNPKAALPPTP